MLLCIVVFVSSDPSSSSIVCSLFVWFAESTTLVSSAAVSRHVGLRASPSSLRAAEQSKSRDSAGTTVVHNSAQHQVPPVPRKESMPISQVTSRFCAKLGLAESEVNFWHDTGIRETGYAVDRACIRDGDTFFWWSPRAAGRR